MVVNSEATTSTSYTDLATNDEINGGVTLSADATLIIKYQATIELPSGVTPETASNRLTIDGSTVAATEDSFRVGIEGGRIVSTCVHKAMFTAGNHTFKVQHKTLNGSSVAWAQRLLEVYQQS